MAECWPVSLCRTSMTRPNEPVPNVFNRSNWSRAAVFCGVAKKKKKEKKRKKKNSDQIKTHSMDSEETQAELTIS